MRRALARAQRVDADQQFHEVVVGRVGGGLDEENILAAHVLLNLDEDLVILKTLELGLRQGRVEMIGDGFRQRRVRVCGDQFHGMRPRRDPVGEMGEGLARDSGTRK